MKSPSFAYTGDYLARMQNARARVKNAETFGNSRRFGTAFERKNVPNFSGIYSEHDKTTETAIVILLGKTRNF